MQTKTKIVQLNHKFTTVDYCTGKISIATDE